MKAAKKWLAGLMTLALLVCSLPAALAADWDSATEVKNYDELTAALKDEKVEEIKIVGEVTVPEGNLEANKPILVGKDGAFKLAPGAVVTSDVPQGKFNYEDQENTWIIVGDTMETFVLYAGDDGCYRVMYGTQPDDINALVKDTANGKVNTLCFSGKDVELTESFDGAVFDVRGGKSLTIAKDVSLKAGMYFNLEGNLVMNEGAKLELPENHDIDGTATFATEDQKPENLNADIEVKAAEKPAEPETPAEEVDSAEPAAPKFTDVAPTSPFAAAIDWAVAKEITLGKTETTFGPADPCTVSHILTFLWRANGKPGAEEGVADRDSAAKWAVEQKMITEDADLTATCTRSMAVTFMWQAAESPKVETEKTFTDVAADADYAAAVAWAVENEITAGTGDGTTFAPDNPCNRGQIVTFLYRSLAE
nr:S-layer homology domain-containing protein [uncultured Oscillibacter sp.]